MSGDYSNTIAVFYEFSLGRHVPEAHLLREIDRFVEQIGRAHV